MDSVSDLLDAVSNTDLLDSYILVYNALALKQILSASSNTVLTSCTLGLYSTLTVLLSYC